MKRTIPIVALMLALSLAFVQVYAFAGAAPSLPAPGGTPGGPQGNRTPGPPSTPGPQGQAGLVTPGAQATAQAGLHGKPAHFRGTITAVDASSLTLQLADGTSVTIALTAETRIKVPGPQAQGDVLLVGMQAMVMATGDATLGWTARSVVAIPGAPVRTHRVGTVITYTAGVSISIEATDGQTYTFALTADTKILPAEQAASLAVGSLVTIIAPRDPAALTWTASGIVVHPTSTP